MIEKLKNNNLSHNCKLSDRVVLKKEQFYTTPGQNLVQLSAVHTKAN